MPLILETAPANEPVTLEEVKAHMRVDHDDEDARIADFIRAATSRFDGRDGSLGLCLITQGWKLTLDRFSPEISIPLPPCQSVDAIRYIAADGTAKTLAASGWRVFGLGAPNARIRPAEGKDWPATRYQPDAVTISFTAGFGNDPADIPEPIRAAIKMRAGHLYEHREGVTLGTGFMTETPDGTEDLVRNYRVWVF